MATYRKRRSQKRKRVYRAKMSVAEEKSRFPSEIFAYKAENAFTERKRHRQTPIYASTERKGIYRPKTALGKAKARLPSENVALKGENASAERNGHSQRRIPSRNSLKKAYTEPKQSHCWFTERRRWEQRQKRIYRKKTSLAKVGTRLSIEYIPRKMNISP